MNVRAKQPILIVEDDEDLVACLSALLEDEGYPVIVTSDGDEALAACAREPAMVLIDFRLPGDLQGADLVKALRERLSPTARVVLLTGDDNISGRAAELGVDDFLGKPFELDALLRLVGTHAR
jgi:DNA-binding response OmpR family regulator